jgi:hypothetical protein
LSRGFPRWKRLDRQWWPAPPGLKRRPQLSHDSLRIAPDPLRREMQQQNAPGRQLIMPDRRTLPVGGEEVIFARVDLSRNARIWPPAIHDGDKGVAIEQPRVENRHRQPGALEQETELGFGHRPDAVANLS